MGGGNSSQTAMVIVWVILIVAATGGAGTYYLWRRRHVAVPREDRPQGSESRQMSSRGISRAARARRSAGE
jgi:hypothetical protein